MKKALQKNLTLVVFLLSLLLFFSCGSSGSGGGDDPTEKCIIGKSTLDNCVLG